ncbi:hypothetical protein [Variovorax paradoxus]|uniref:Uncharacterized protein n=1 Tax=Variovorax paradoxus TaxID=34073 RepID=A0A0H2M6G5_VARPD|nr:hypothetical protein [Variovorax paradoxus]KLN56377.1 hypothetical protein VPARA_23190 [Variovorax paradoxus]
MTEDDEKQVREELWTLGIENQVLHSMIGALFAVHPQKELMLTNFREQIDSLCRFAPDGIDPEHLVELRARAAQHELALRKIDPIG